MTKLVIVSILLTLASAGCVTTSKSQQPVDPQSWGSYEVIDHFQFSGVPAGASALLAPDDLPALPHLPAEAHEFTIVILPDCAPCKGRVYSFASQAEAADALALLGGSAAKGAAEFGWAYGRGNVVVLLDKGVPEPWARAYNTALQNMGE